MCLTNGKRQIRQAISRIANRLNEEFIDLEISYI